MEENTCEGYYVLAVNEWERYVKFVPLLYAKTSSPAETPRRLAAFKFVHWQPHCKHCIMSHGVCYRH